MLYFRALLVGLDAMPDVDPEVRAGLRARLPLEGSEILHAELSQVDPEAAGRIHPRDPQRILRALEVHLSTGRTLSSFQQGRRASLPEGWRQLALWPEDRAGLRERIARRFDAMLAQGFVRELETLRARPLLTAEHTSQRAVGYRQGWDWLEGRIDQATFRERAIHATRQLAKRQLTWLRGMPGGGAAGRRDGLCRAGARATGREAPMTSARRWRNRHGVVLISSCRDLSNSFHHNNQIG